MCEWPALQALSSRGRWGAAQQAACKMRWLEGAGLSATPAYRVNALLPAPVAASRRPKGEPACCVCMSGGYDDNDHGDWLIYTGTGKSGVQAWESGGNRALLEAWQQGTPVRVARGGCNVGG